MKQPKKFKRGDKVRVVLEGIVMRSSSFGIDDPDGIQVSVKFPKMKKAWWAIVPESAVKKC